MRRMLGPGIALAVLAASFGGAAMAQTYPGGSKTGASGLTNAALVTITIPAVLSIDVEHNFVLDLTSPGCRGSGAAFPSNTTYTFAVNSANTAGTADVACPGTGAAAARSSSWS